MMNMIEQINLYMYFKFKLSNERIQKTIENDNLIYLFDLDDKIIELNELHIRGNILKLYKHFLAVYVNDLTVASIRYTNIHKIEVK